MADKSFGIKKFDLIGSGTPKIESPNNINLNAVNVAISTNATVGGTLDVEGASGFGTHISLPDHAKIRLGNTVGDFDIYYDDNVYLKTGSKGFNIQSYNGHFRISTGANDDLKFAFSVVGIVCADDLIPEANGTRDLGLNGTKWKDAYLSGTVNANTFSGSGASLTGIANANISNSAAIDLSKLATGALPTGITIASANLVDGTIVNTDISTSAAIAGTKISPDFGTQNITTTGTLGSGDLTITGTQPALSFIDDGQNPDYKLYNNNGILKLFDTTNSNDYVVVQPIISSSRQDLQVGIFTDFNGGSSTYRAGTFGNVLEIFGGGASSEGALRIGANSGATNNSTGIIQFFDDTLDSSNVASIAAYKVPHNSTSTNRGCDLVFRTKVDQGSLTEKFRITDNGNVGIGTDLFPQLVVDSGNTAVLAVGIVTAHTFISANGLSRFNTGISTFPVGASVYTSAVTMTGDNDHGGTQRNAALQIHNTSLINNWGIVIRSKGDPSLAMVFYDDDDDNCGRIQINNNSTDYVETSDYRIKENETPILDGITRLKQLKPYRFNFKKSPSITRDGFFAHEVQSVVPEAVTGTKDEVDSDGYMMVQGIDKSKLIPLLTAALQEEVAKREALEARIAALES